jgi:hypothetical protein
MRSDNRFAVGERRSPDPRRIAAARFMLLV